MMTSERGGGGSNTFPPFTEEQAFLYQLGSMDDLVIGFLKSNFSPPNVMIGLLVSLTFS